MLRRLRWRWSNRRGLFSLRNVVGPAVEQQLHGRVYAVAGRQWRCPRSSRLRRRRRDRPGALRQPGAWSVLLSSANYASGFSKVWGSGADRPAPMELRRRRQGGPRHLSSVRAVGGAARERQLFNEGFRCMGAKHGRSYRPLAAVVRHLRPARFLLPRKDWPKDLLQRGRLAGGRLANRPRCLGKIELFQVDVRADRSVDHE